MDVQHVNVKIFTLEPFAGDSADAIPVFHGWIQRRARPELLIDVADYRHVPEGPGVMLIGHEADYSLDYTGGRLGLLYNRKRAESGTTADKLRQAYDSAVAACKLMEDEPAFRGKLKFDTGDCEVIINDRLLAPNSPKTLNLFKPELKEFFTGLWGESDFVVEQVGEPRDRFRVRVKVKSGDFQPV